MLINATQEEELRVALVDGQRLYDLDIENRTRVQKKASIYKGRITRVEPSLEAAFVDFGADRHGFLPLKEISPEYYKAGSDTSDSGRVSIKDVIAENTEVIVQVEKEERGSKGAALTTHISLAGRYLVLMPNNPRAGGISRRIEGEERAEIRDIISSLDIPDGMGIIVRTAGVGKQQEELQWDLDYLLSLWRSIRDASDNRKAPFLIYQESNVIIRTIRDYLRQDIGEVLFDTRDAYEEAVNFVKQVMPHYESRIKLYDEPLPLFNRFQIESQIESAYQREVKLPSGGSIVIDPTEALVSIDINSARSTRGSDIEETAFNTNLEAADEVARQLRLRDMGGLVVIDFIDMNSNRNQKEVESRMREALEADRARVQVGRISRFGLLEMSRQRMQPSLEETSAIICPRCNGQGAIRSIKSLCLSILRVLQEEANKPNSSEIHAIVPISVAAYLLNEKRTALAEIEEQSQVRLLIVPSATLETPHYDIRSINRQELEGGRETSSYEIDTRVEEEPEYDHDKKPEPPPQAAVKAPTMSQAPTPSSSGNAPRKGFFGSLLSAFSGVVGGSANDEEESDRDKPARGGQRSGRQRSGGGRGTGSGGSTSRKNSGPRKSQSRQGGDEARKDEDRPRGGRKKAGAESAKESGGKSRRSSSGGRGRKSEGKSPAGDDQERQPKEQSNQPKGKSQKKDSDKPKGADTQSPRTSDKAEQAQASDSGDSQEGSGKARRRSGRKPRNTTPRKRGPRPDTESRSSDADSESPVSAGESTDRSAAADAPTGTDARSAEAGPEREEVSDRQAAEAPSTAGETSPSTATAEDAAARETDDKRQADPSTKAAADEDQEQPKKTRSRSRGGSRGRKSGSTTKRSGSTRKSDDAASADAEGTGDDKAAAGAEGESKPAKSEQHKKPSKKQSPKAEEPEPTPAETGQTNRQTTTDSAQQNDSTPDTRQAPAADTGDTKAGTGKEDTGSGDASERQEVPIPAKAGRAPNDPRERRQRQQKKKPEESTTAESADQGNSSDDS